MKIRQLEAFRALILRQTVTRAAQMLHISQPAVTRLINDLETDVGFALFDRAHGRLHPTPEGLALFEEIERSFTGLERIAQTAQQIKSLRRGSLHIAGAPAIALEFLPAVLTDFMREHSGIDTTLVIHSSRTVVDLVGGRRCDVGFIIHALSHGSVQVDTLCRTAMVCALPPGHRLASRAVIRPADLRGESFISFPAELDARLTIDQVFTAHRVQRVLTCEVQLSAAACALVGHGAGVALIDPVTAHYHAGHVVVRPFEPAVPCSYALVTSNQHPVSLLAAAFIEHVQQRLVALVQSAAA